LSAALDRARRRAEDAKAAERRARLARDELQAIVAHDLKNPLSVIASHACLLGRAGDAGELPPDVARSVTVIGRSAQRMTRFVSDLLDASFIDTGSLALDRAPVDVSELVAHCLEAQREAAVARGLGLTGVTCTEATVLGDAERLAQVLTNLVGNAIKFTPAGGAVTGRATHTGDRVRVEVDDTGRGIETEHLQTIFDRYAHGRRASGSESGLGLYIARGIVRAHGGVIGVKSWPGSGSLFWLELPAAPCEKVPTADSLRAPAG
jgi:signal transduction histidine kinase